MRIRYEKLTRRLAAIIPAIALIVVGKSTFADEPLDVALHEQIISVPGDPARPVILQVTTFSPDGGGPFPLAVLNHGKEYGNPKEQPRYRSAYLARYFLSRGYAVVLPMMRGFAGSGGVFDPHGCDVEDDGLSQAKDIAAVIKFMAKQPKIDSNRIVVSGQSMGGWNSLAFAARGFPGVKGILNFAGGIRQPKCPNWQANLIKAAGDYGARTKIPSLWFYGDNDSLFPPSVWHGMYDHYVQAGGPATLTAFGTFISDAHNMLGSLEGFPIWMSKVDTFLTSVGLPGKETDPKYLPAPAPPASHFADIDDVNAVPYLDSRGRETYRAFLTKPFPRVFIIAPRGLAAYFDLGYDPLTQGMEKCQEIAPAAQLYAVDDQVVWTKPDPVRMAEVYQREAPKGNIRAELLLGRAYATGSGVAKDYGQAFYWLQKAAQLGYAPAESDLGTLFETGLGTPRDYAQAMGWYEKAAGLRNGAAEEKLGYMYFKGWGGPQNYQQALTWFDRASEDGSLEAQNQIGNMYAQGKGVLQSYQQAQTWYRKAADRGFRTAEYSLGFMYQNGLGIPADTSQALLWYQKAADQGFTPATRAIAILKADEAK